MHTIRMAHPAKNALGSGLMDWLEAELEAAGDGPVLLTGTDDAFCAGLDLREVQAQQQAGTLVDFCLRIDRLAVRLREHAGPTVACVNGHAIAGGCVLTMCCDYRIATTNPRTRIGLNEVALGVTFPAAILKQLMQRLPNQHRERVLLGGELFTPEDALRVGLVDELAEDPLAAAEKRLALLARNPAPAYARTKELLVRATRLSAEEEQAFLAVDGPIWNSPDVAARIDAVLGKK